MTADLIYENTDLKRRLRESEDLRKSLVSDAAERVLFQVSMQERLESYEAVIVAARSLRDSETGAVNIENLLSFFEILDEIPVPS